MVTKIIKPICSIIAVAAIAIMSGSVVYAAEVGCEEASIVQLSMKESDSSINNVLSVSAAAKQNLSVICDTSTTHPYKDVALTIKALSDTTAYVYSSNDQVAMPRDYFSNKISLRGYYPITMKSGESVTVNIDVKRTGDFNIQIASDSGLQYTSPTIHSEFYYIEGYMPATVKGDFLKAVRAEYNKFPEKIRKWLEAEGMCFEIHDVDHFDLIERESIFGGEIGYAAAYGGDYIQLSTGYSKTGYCHVLHEMGHVIHRHIALKNPGFNYQLERFYDVNDTYYRTYARENFVEFFADSVKAYFNDAETFKLTHRELYNLIDDIMNNPEKYAVPDTNSIIAMVNNNRVDNIKNINSVLNVTVGDWIYFQRYYPLTKEMIKRWSHYGSDIHIDFDVFSNGQRIYRGKGDYCLSQAGDYDIKVRVLFGDKEYYVKSIKVKVNHKVKNQSTLSTNHTYRNYDVRINLSQIYAIDTPMYAVYVKYPGKDGYVRVSDYSTSNTLSYRPQRSGTYYFKTKVKDSRGYVSNKLLKLVVKDPQNKSTINKTTLNRGDSFTITCKSEGMVGVVTYSAYIKRNNQKSYTRIAKDSSDAIIRYKPTSEGTYTVLIRAKDIRGTVLQKTFTITVKAIKNTSSLSTDSTYRKNTVLIKMNQTNAVGTPQYAVYIKTPGQNIYTKLSGYSTSSTLLYTPQKSGTYYFKTKVKDSRGYESNKVLKLVVKEPKNVSTIDRKVINYGEAVFIASKTEGLVGKVTYSVYTKKSDQNNYVRVYKDSKKTVFKVTPANPGTYTILIRAKDSKNTVVQKTFTITVREVKNTSTISADNPCIGKKININLSYTGGDGIVTGAVYVRKPGATKDDKVFENTYNQKTGSETVSYISTDKGKHVFKVKIWDKMGREKTKTFTVNVAAIINDSYLSKSVAKTGNTVFVYLSKYGRVGTITTTVLVKKDEEKDSRTLIKNTTNPVIAFTPETRGNYIITVKCKDKSNNIVSKDLTLKVTGIKNQSTVSASTVGYGKSFVVYSKYQDEFGKVTTSIFVKEPGSNKYQKIIFNSKKTNITLTPNKKGTFKYLVKVKDEKGNYSSKVFTINVQ